MELTINECRLNVEDLGPRDAPLVIALHGGGGIGSLEEPKATFGSLADEYRVIVFDQRGCGRSEAVEPYSHAQWCADIDALREWAGAEKVAVAGGSYGGFLALEYAIRYPERINAVILRDTAPDGTKLSTAFENARHQDRIEINWDDFNRYWSGTIRDDADLKHCWAGMIGLYDHKYDPARSAERVNAGFYRHEAHNWCFQHNWNTYDVKNELPSVAVPMLVTVGRHDWVVPVSCSEMIAELVPDAELVIFEQSGHSPQVEERELFQQTVRDFIHRAVPVTTEVVL